MFSNSIKMLMCIKAFSYFTLNHQPLTFAEQAEKKYSGLLATFLLPREPTEPVLGKKRLPSPPAWASMSEAATEIPEGRPSSLAASGMSPLPRQVPGGSTKFPG